MSAFVKRNLEDHIISLQLDRGKSNAMHTEMIEELTVAFQEIENDPNIRAAILTGKEDFFSSGLDLIELFGYNQQEMRTFWTKFIELVYHLVNCSKPVVCSITGHSPAGGCVLALSADYRLMAEGDYVIGLNEVPVGIIVPHSIASLYAFWIGTANASRFLLEGTLMKPKEAQSVGLVDQVVPFQQIHTAATRQLKSYLQFDQHAWRASKRYIRQDLLKAIGETTDTVIEEVLEQWWRPSTRNRLQSIIETLSTKR